MRKPAFAYVKTKVQIIALHGSRAADQCLYLSGIMRKPTFCICEIKGAEKLCDRAADQRLCLS